MFPPPEIGLLSFDSTSSIIVSATTILLPSITSSIAPSSATSSVYPDESSAPPSTDGECHLLGPFAILVQGALGLLALTALVFKRWRERPQRPVKIWLFDISKQIMGSFLVHMANLAMSMLSSGQVSIRVDPSVVNTKIGKRLTDGGYSPNPCSFYLLNLAIDTTIGIPILIFLLRIITSLLIYSHLVDQPESIESGNYGTPPSPYRWFQQSLIYFLGLFGMKICVLLVFLMLPWISHVGDWALKWTEGDEALQVVFVMLIFPLIMNATQYYIIDSFIKNQKIETHELIPDSDPGERYLYSESASDEVAENLLIDNEDNELELTRNSKELNQKIRNRIDVSGEGR